MEIEELEDRISDLESQMYDLIEIVKPLTIGNEQLWEVVFNTILKEPVPRGEDLRHKAKRL